MMSPTATMVMGDGGEGRLVGRFGEGGFIRGKEWCFRLESEKKMIREIIAKRPQRKFFLDTRPL